MKSGIPLSWFSETVLKYKTSLMEMVFLAICLRFIGLVEPFVFQVIIDKILPFQREASLMVVIIIFITVSIFQLGFEFISEILSMVTTNRITIRLAKKVFEETFHLPVPHFRRWSVGEIITRIGEIDTIRSFLVNTTTGVFLDVIFLFIYFIVLAAISTPLTLILIVALPIHLAIYQIYGPFLRKRLRSQFDAGANHHGRMVEDITGISAIKSLSAEKKARERLNDTLSASISAGYKVGMTQLFHQKTVFLVDRIVAISLIFFGSRMVLSGELTLGELIAFHLLSTKVTGPIENFSDFWESWQNLRISRQRLGDIVLAEKEKFAELPILPSDVSGELVFDNVYFEYEIGTPILDGFSFESRPNSLNVVIGPSGVGKSTFGRLCSGIEVPNRGVVKLGGLDISQYDPHSIRRQIAYVPQEPYLFSGTLRDNLLFGNEQLSEDELVSALKLAAAEDLLDRLPQGLDTQVGERGSQLSGGQKQRVAMARSLLLYPKVLVLDEPTSALDVASQLQMVAGLKSLKQSTTVIVITHSPELFADADQTIDFGNKK